MDPPDIDADGETDYGSHDEQLYSSDDKQLQLLPVPPDDFEYTSRDALIRDLQAFAQPHGYAFVIRRSIKFKNGPHVGTPQKVYLRCDRGGKQRQPRGRNRRYGASRLTDCPCKIIAKRTPATDRWHFQVESAYHNHEGSTASSHPSLRGLQITRDLKKIVKSKDKHGATPAQTLAELKDQGKQVHHLPKAR